MPQSVSTNGPSPGIGANCAVIWAMVFPRERKMCWEEEVFAAMVDSTLRSPWWIHSIYDARTCCRPYSHGINSHQQHLSMFPPPGPQLPSFNTLLITGPYHPSAPIHLALSLDQRAILLSPSRDAFLEDLQQFNDSWLNSHSGKGRFTSLTSNISIL